MFRNAFVSAFEKNTDNTVKFSNSLAQAKVAEEKSPKEKRKDKRKEKKEARERKKEEKKKAENEEENKGG